MAHAEFIASAWFYVNIDIPFEDGTDEYNQAVDKVIEDFEFTNATLFTPYDTYYSDSVEAKAV